YHINSCGEKAEKVKTQLCQWVIVFCENYKQLSEEYYSCNRDISKEVVASEYAGTMRLK
ncbi:hypothetical protein LINPERPRIM_LOCUS4266, partial [Linum perenne]